MEPKLKREAERRANRANRTREIVDAAERIFFEKGLAEATMMDIAAEAEISRVTLYKYFKDKGELALEVLIRVFEILAERVKPLEAFEGTGFEILEKLADVFFQLYIDYPDQFTFIGDFDRFNQAMDPESDRTARFMKYSLGIDQFIREVIKKGIADGSVAPDSDPEKVALMTGDIFFSYSYRLRVRGQVLADEDNFDHSELMRLLFDMILKSLKN